MKRIPMNSIRAASIQSHARTKPTPLVRQPSVVQPALQILTNIESHPLTTDRQRLAGMDCEITEPFGGMYTDWRLMDLLGRVDRTMQDEAIRPTLEVSGELQQAFDYFNEVLFRKEYGVLLPHVIVTLIMSRRRYGHFVPDVWGKAEAETNSASEIALNLSKSREPKEIYGTLVHEQVHLAQAKLPHIFGQSGKRGYHNKAFARVMKRIGLMASNTGEPGGKETGRQMTHYVIEGGAFDVACRRFVEQGATVSWVHSLPLAEGGGIEHARQKKNRSKTKFSCS